MRCACSSRGSQIRGKWGGGVGWEGGGGVGGTPADVHVYVVCVLVNTM